MTSVNSPFCPLRQSTSTGTQDERRTRIDWSALGALKNEGLKNGGPKFRSLHVEKEESQMQIL